MHYASYNKQSNNIEAWQDVNASPYIQIKNITKSHGNLSILKNISLDIYRGEFFSLLGESGCGKSTLLRIISGLDEPTSGEILIDGINIINTPPYSRPVNMMFQSYALFPHMTVKQNIVFGLKNDKLSKSEIDNRVREMLQLLKIDNLEDRFPSQLSGGQKQRVALARSLAKRPKLLLLDEPMAALDQKLREQTQFELVNIQEKVGITFITVTHDQEEAMTMSTRMAIMCEGNIKQVGTPRDIYEFPNSNYVASFIGDINKFNGVVIDQDDEHIVIESEEIDCVCYAVNTDQTPVGSRVTFAIRPEKIMLSKIKPQNEQNCMYGIIREIAYLGDMSIYHISVETGKIIKVALPNLLRLSKNNMVWDDSVYLFWRAENSVVLTS